MKKKKNRIVKVGIDIGIYLLILVVLHIFLGRPVIKLVNKEKEKLRDVQKKLQEMESLVRNIPDPKKKMEKLKKDIEKLKNKSASDKELPRVIRELTKKSSELNIEIISIRPISEIFFEEKELPRGVSKSYIEVVLKAPYKIIGKYLKALEELPIILTIETLSIEKPEELLESTEKKEITKEVKKKKEEKKVIATLLISSYTVPKI